jgi:hypothetical protein
MAGTAIRLHGVTSDFSRVRAIPLSKAFGCPAGPSFDNVERMLRQRYAAEIPAIEGLYLQRLTKTHDALEGARAFLDKRVPDWRDG